MDQAVSQPFLDFLRFEKRYSKHTLVAYETDLVDFFDYLEIEMGGLSLEQVTHGHVRSWLAKGKDSGLSAKTLNRKISTLRSFFKYALKTGRLERSPMDKVVAPRPEKRLPQFIKESEIEAIWTELSFPDTWKGRTDRLVLRTFYQTGMRLAELIGLKESAVMASNHTIRILGKGNKERILPVSPGLLSELQDYMAEKRRLQGSGSETVFATEKGKPLAPRSVYASVKKYLSQITSIEKRSPHVLRHSFATHLMNSGAALNAVKDLLGHSSLAATQVYTHNTIEKLKDVHKNFHPKA